MAWCTTNSQLIEPMEFDIGNSLSGKWPHLFDRCDSGVGRRWCRIQDRGHRAVWLSLECSSGILPANGHSFKQQL